MAVTELHDSTYLVTLSSDVRYQLEEELYRFQYKLKENFEIGGLLFGTVREGRINVELATGPGPDFEPEINQVDLNYSKVLGADEARVAGDLVIGSWHAHPKPHLLRAADPSPEDFQHWESVLRRSREEAIVGLIAIEGRTAVWRSPRLHAWVTHRSNGEIVCERVGELHK